MKPWTNHQVARLRQMWAEGASIDDITAAVGHSRGSTLKYANSLGLGQRMRTWTSEEDETLKTLWRQGTPAKGIAHAVDRQPDAVWRRARILKLQPRKSTTRLKLKALSITFNPKLHRLVQSYATQHGLTFAAASRQLIYKGLFGKDA